MMVVFGFEPTDTGNSYRFASHHNKYLRHVTGVGWFYCNTEQWEPADDSKILKYALQTVESISREAKAYFLGRRRTLLLWAKNSRGRQKEMIVLAKSLLVAKIEQLDVGPWWLSTDEAAARLGVSSSTLRVWRTRDKGPEYKKWERQFKTRIHYCSRSVEEWRSGRASCGT